jgi:hypothetical protein
MNNFCFTTVSGIDLGLVGRRFDTTTDGGHVSTRCAAHICRLTSDPQKSATTVCSTSPSGLDCCSLSGSDCCSLSGLVCPRLLLRDRDLWVVHRARGRQTRPECRHFGHPSLLRGALGPLSTHGCFGGAAGVCFSGALGVSFSSALGVCFSGASGVCFSSASGVCFSSASGVRFSGASGVCFSCASGVRFSSASGVRFSSASGVCFSSASGVRFSSALGVCFSSASGVRFSSASGVRCFSDFSSVRFSGTAGVCSRGSLNAERCSLILAGRCSRRLTDCFVSLAGSVGSLGDTTVLRSHRHCRLLRLE